jgi:GGDEF domain-containing protein
MLRIKVSAGIAAGPEDGVTFDELMKKAVLALKQAKKGGRDRSVAASEIRGRMAGRSSWIT